MASLLSLPEELHGEIYAKLPDAQTRRAFFQCCKEVHDSRYVLDHIRTLRVDLPLQEQGQLDSAVEQLLKVPRCGGAAAVSALLCLELSVNSKKYMHSFWGL